MALWCSKFKPPKEQRMDWRGKAGVREPKSMLFQPGKASDDNGQTREGECRAWVSEIYKGGSGEFGEGLWGVKSCEDHGGRQ